MTFEGGTFVVQCFGEHFCDLSGSQDPASLCQENAKAVVALVRILCRRQKHVISHEKLKVKVNQPLRWTLRQYLGHKSEN